MKSGRTHRLFPCFFGVRHGFRTICGLGCVLLFGLILLLSHLPSGRRPGLNLDLRYDPAFSPNVFLDNLIDADRPPAALRPADEDRTFSMSCYPKKHVFFLKVHKSGSTTVANILQRFALRKHLNLLLPNRLPGTYGFNVLSRTAYLPPNAMIPPPPGDSYHIVCNHMVYNRTAVRQLLPPDSVSVAIAREPESRFVSAMTYYGMLEHLSRSTKGRSNSSAYMFSEYLANPRRYGQPPEVSNTLAFNFGIPVRQYHNKTFLREFTRRLDEEFLLVMLMEKFDEGLLLLRRLLCWDLQDIIYIKRNEGTQTPDYAMSEDDRRHFQKWQEADIFIYQYVYRRFHQLVAAQGADFYQELVHFHLTQRRVRDYCVHNRDDYQEELVIEESRFNREFTVVGEDCSLMLAEELTLVEALMTRAWDKYHEAGGLMTSYQNHVSEDFKELVAEARKRNREEAMFESTDIPGDVEVKVGHNPDPGDQDQKVPFNSLGANRNSNNLTFGQVVSNGENSVNNYMQSKNDRMGIKHNVLEPQDRDPSGFRTLSPQNRTGYRFRPEQVNL